MTRVTTVATRLVIALHVRHLADGIAGIGVVVAGLLCVHWHAHWQAPEPVLVLARPMVAVALAVAIAAQWIERVCTILYEWPPRSGWRGRRPVREQPLIRIPLYTLLYLGTSWSTDVLAVAQSRAVPLPIRVATIVAVVTCALPFWLVATQPRRYWRCARATATPRRSAAA